MEKENTLRKELNKAYENDGSSLNLRRKKLVERVINARTIRDSTLPSYLFSDAAWEILLQLYAKSLSESRFAVTELCEAVNVPSTTALRFIRTLQDEGLVVRTADPFDARRYYLTLSAKGLRAMNDFFDSIAVAK